MFVKSHLTPTASRSICSATLAPGRFFGSPLTVSLSPSTSPLCEAEAVTVPAGSAASVSTLSPLATSSVDLTDPTGSDAPFFCVADAVTFSPSTGSASFASSENLLS
jgi:hypothetical protein